MGWVEWEIEIGEDDCDHEMILNPMRPILTPYDSRSGRYTHTHTHL